MSDATPPKVDFTRRALFAAAGAGATLAVAALAKPIFRQATGGGFDTTFKSPYGSLQNADHNVWRTKVGQTLQVSTGQTLQVAKVETFVPFRAKDTRSVRSRAFMVSFDVVGAGIVAGDTIHRVNHPQLGTLDLFLTAPANRPGRVQAVFN